MVPLTSGTGILNLLILYVNETSGANQSQASQGSPKPAWIFLNWLKVLLHPSSPLSNQFQWQRLTYFDEVFNL